MWTRNFGFPTAWSATVDGRVVTVTLEASRPMHPAIARVEFDGRLAGRYESLPEAKAAVEAELAFVPTDVSPVTDEIGTQTTMGAALLSGRPDVLVSQETVEYDARSSPYQRAVYDFIRFGKGNAIVEAVAGSGKCLGEGTPVMLHNGRIVPVESVKVGDRLMGPDSEPREVLSTNVGHGPLWRITPVKGDSWVCNDVHVMTLAGTNGHFGKIIDIPLNEHIAKHGHLGRVDRDWKLMRAGVSFPRCDVPVDPYLVGLWIGDGTFDEAHITNCESEIRDYCRRIAPAYGAELVEREDSKHNTWNLRFRVAERDSETSRPPNALRRFFRDDCTRDGSKSIPDCYLYNDEATRLAILAGIVDTDGFVDHGMIELTTVSPVLRDQYLYLARSLGFAAYTSEKVATIKSIGFTGLYQRVTISGDVDRIPCLLARRQAPERRQIKRVSVTGFDAEPIGEGDYYGFTLDRDGRFLLGDFTVTHNTTTLMKALEYIPRNAAVLILAFNTSIALELQSRAPRGRNLTIKTLVGWGNSFLSRHWKTGMASPAEGKRRDAAVIAESIPSFKESGLAYGEAKDEGTYAHLSAMASKLIGLCMAYMASTTEAITETQREHELFVDDNGDPEGFVLYGKHGPAGSPERPVKWTHRDVVQWVKDAMRLQLIEPRKGGSISFRDMVFVPAMNTAWKAPELYDFVFVDETQDCDPAQLSLVMRAVKPHGRIVVIGDRNQAIYAFRGADTDAMPRLERELKATRLPLSVSYRVTQCAAEEARKVVPEFEIPKDEYGRPLATPGVCNEISAHRMANLWNAGDVVISRTREAGDKGSGLLGKIALKVFATGKVPYVLGDTSALTNILTGAIRETRPLMRTGKDSIEDFRVALAEWVNRGQQRFRLHLIKTREEQVARGIRYRGYQYDDEVDTFEEWKRFDEIASCFFNGEGTGVAQQEGVQTLGQVEDLIRQLSPDDEVIEKMTPERFKRLTSQCVTISTVHQIKGAEFNRVFVLESTFSYTRKGPKFRRKQRPKQAIEERNLWYVAITRVKGEHGDPARGIPVREGELYYVNDIEALVNGRNVKDLKEVMK